MLNGVTGRGAALSERVRLSEEKRLDWLRLIRTDNIGPRTFRDLVNHYGGARAALGALPALARRGGASAPARICSSEDAETELKAARTRGIDFVALGEPDYPPRLQMIYDAPSLLAVRGKLAVLTRPLVAIVGSRNVSAAGVKFAERLARDLGAAGFGTVSGLTRGIDAAAHRVSLATGTIAVLAGGQDRVYPAEHSDLLEAILAEGAAVSEMPLAWEPRARLSAPQRADLGLVGRRGDRGGGAPLRLANHRAAGRRTGPRNVRGARLPLVPRAEGTNGLLKQAATLVTEAADVIAVLEPILGRGFDLPAQEPTPDVPGPLDVEPGEDERACITGLLGPTPVSLDDLVRLSHTSPAIVRTVLLELEIAGRLERHGGSFVSLL
jgi:DNA processing protein